MGFFRTFRLAGRKTWDRPGGHIRIPHMKLRTYSFPKDLPEN